METTLLVVSSSTKPLSNLARMLSEDFTMEYRNLFHVIIECSGTNIRSIRAETYEVTDKGEIRFQEFSSFIQGRSPECVLNGEVRASRFPGEVRNDVLLGKIDQFAAYAQGFELWSYNLEIVGSFCSVMEERIRLAKNL